MKNRFKIFCYLRGIILAKLHGTIFPSYHQHLFNSIYILVLQTFFLSSFSLCRVEGTKKDSSFLRLACGSHLLCPSKFHMNDCFYILINGISAALQFCRRKCLSQLKFLTPLVYSVIFLKEETFEHFNIF